jgi:hypothetical protein
MKGRVPLTISAVWSEDVDEKGQIQVFRRDEPERSSVKETGVLAARRARPSVCLCAV